MSLPILNEILILIIAAFVGGFLARSIKLPPVVGYIASGIFFGLLGGKIFPSYSALLDLSQIGISLLLFTLGFEISLEHLRHIKSKVFFIGMFQVCITSLVFFLLLLFAQFDVKTSLLFSILLSFSSTAVVVKLLEERGLLNDFPGNNIFIFLLVQDLFIIPVIFLAPVIFSKTDISLLVVSSLILSLLKAFLIFMIIFWVSKFLLPKFMNILFRYPSHELNILATIFITALCIGVLIQVGVPLAIASFLAGVVISEEGKNIAPLSEIRPFRDIFLVLFFVTVGMLIDSSYVFSHLPQIVSLTILIIALKFFIIYIVLRFSGYLSSSSAFISSYLANIGEFAPVIAQVSFISGHVSKESYNVLLSSFVLSLVLIPFSVRYLRVLGRGFSTFKFFPDFGESIILGEESHIKTLKNHVVICGHGRVGSKIRAMLDLAGVEYCVADFNRRVITDLVGKGKRAVYGDPTDLEVLVGAGTKYAKVLVVAVPDTLSQKKIIKGALSLNPKLIIVARSHIEEDRYDLINMGVNSIVIPELEAGLRIGVEVLRVFGTDEDTITNAVRRLRKDLLL